MSLWVAEHGRIYKERSGQILDLKCGDISLGKDDFDSLHCLVEENEQSELDPVLKYSFSKDQRFYKVQGYVGVVRTSTDCQFEILPKIAKSTSADRARKLLIKMLIELEDSQFKKGVLSNLNTHKMTLYELFMRQFLDRVADIVKKGIARSYVNQQGNLSYLRGKLLLQENIKRNSADMSHFFCEYDEFYTNRPINRLIKSALNMVAWSSRESSNLQLCQELSSWFENVPASLDVERDFRAVRHDRLIQQYLPAMPLCRMILNGLNPLTEQGKNQTQSILFPMSKIFEQYVYKTLSSQLQDWIVRYQVQERNLVESHIGKDRGEFIGRFRLKPDLEFTKKTDNLRVIGDAKWKLIDKDHGKNYDIEASDVYQMFAYAMKYLECQQKKQVLLIYPKTETFDKPLAPFWFKNVEDHEEVIYVVPFDLKANKLIWYEGTPLFDFETMPENSIVAT